MLPKLTPLADVIRMHGLSAKKSLGQHFLLDTELLRRVVAAAGDLAGVHVIEVGPGPGGLTRALLDSPAHTLIAIEKDRRCLEALAPLKEQYPGRFHLIEEDAMQVSLTSIGQGPRAVVANLPYNIGTALIVGWLQEVAAKGPGTLQGFTVMLQKEVAERMVAEPGSKAYGRISVLMRQFTDAFLAFDIPPSAFVPPPKVVSSVVHATILRQPREDVPLALLESVVAAAFNQRRKMLRQSLKALGGDPLALCDRARVDPTLRAEQCSLAMFAALARAL